MKKMKRSKILLVCLLVVALSVSLVGCGKDSSDSTDTSGTSGDEEGVPRIAVVTNRSFGDNGPIDSQMYGVEKAEELGFETKTLESLTPDVFEEDLRAMAKEGYDIIVTSFPPVSEAAMAVAKDYPETKFVGIYQFVNADGEGLDNFWSIEYKSQDLMYVMGAIHAKLTKTKKIGIISGQETASGNSEINGFIDGVVATDPECSVEFAYANTYDDPAVGKEIANAMISRGIDTICLVAGKTSLGALEAAEEAGIYATADNGDHFERAPHSLPTHLMVNFGTPIEQAVNDYLNGEFKGGEHSEATLVNKGSYVAWDTIDRFIDKNPEKEEEVLDAINYAKTVEEKVMSGEIEVEFKPDTPKAYRP